MRSAPPAVAALINSGQDYETADLYTITLSGGAVVRWSGADVALTSDGNTFALGPAIDRGAISEKVGLEVSTLQITITADADDLINGTPIIPFAARRGLDGANIRLERAYLTDWGNPVVGTLLRFAGRVTSIDEIGGSSLSLTVSSWLILLNAMMPANLYQAACLHTVYDQGCGLDPAAFAVTGAITGTPSATAFATTLSAPVNDFAQGRIVFTSGANTGVSVSVRGNDGAGNFTLIRNLPAAPAAGDSFTAYPGCDLTRGRCQTRFNNLGRHKATPFVPVPETAFG